MTSLLTSPRQLSRDGGYFIPVGDCRGKIYEYNPVSGVSTAAVWATNTSPSTACFISSAGAGVLKDMGKTVVSSTRVFRKVQLLISTANLLVAQGVQSSVGGPVGQQGEDYLTGYIELGFNGGQSVAPVANYGR